MTLVESCDEDLFKFLRVRLSETMLNAGDKILLKENIDRYLTNLRIGKLGDFSKRLVVNYEDGKAKGLLIAIIKDKTLHITTLGVSENSRGCGIGKKLLEFSRQHAVTLGCSQQILNVSEDNSVAYNLYKKVGFKKSMACVKEKMDLTVKELVKTLSQEPDTVGLLLLGSLTTGDLHRNSDIDLMVVKNDSDNITYGKVVNGINVQLLQRSLSDYKIKMLKVPRQRPLSFSAKVLYDPSGEITDYLNQAKALLDDGPMSLSDQERLIKRIILTDEVNTAKGLLESGRMASARLLIYDVVKAGIDLYYDIKGHFIVSPKILFDDFKRHDEGLGKMAEEIVLANDMELAIERLEIFRQVILDLCDGPVETYELRFT